MTLKFQLADLQRKAKERTVRTQNIEYDLETLVKKIDRKTIKLNPDYQRRHRWTVEASSRLIESLILNIPITLAAVSREAGLSSSTLANAFSRPWPKGEWIIADYLGIHPSEIWPSRYFDMYGQLIERKVRKVSTE